jgi:hypothetical protein
MIQFPFSLTRLLFNDFPNDSQNSKPAARISNTFKWCGNEAAVKSYLGMSRQSRPTLTSGCPQLHYA